MSIKIIVLAVLALSTAVLGHAGSIPDASPMVVAQNNCPAQSVIEDQSGFLYSTEDEATKELTAAKNLLQYHGYVILRAYVLQGGMNNQYGYRIYFLPSNAR